MGFKAELSAVIIAKNEESRIEDCIRSVLWAAEIVVVDDESSDRTCEIAEKLGARAVIRRMDAEGRQRNFACSLAQSPWILVLDAGERATPELEAEIRKTIARTDAANGYDIPGKNFVGSYWVRHGGMDPSRKLKLFRRGVLRYEDEAEINPGMILAGPRGALSEPLLHYAYRDFSDVVAGLDRRTDLEALKRFRQKRGMIFPLVLLEAFAAFAVSYVWKRGFSDGVIGLFLSVHAGMRPFLTYLKLRELKNPPRSVPT